MMLSLIFAVIAAFLVLVAEAMLENPSGEIREEGLIGFLRDSLTSKSYERALIFGLVIGAIRYFASVALPWGAIICYVALICVFVYLCQYWHRDGSELRELAVFILLAIVAIIAGAKATALLSKAANAKNLFLGFLVARLPRAALIATIGFYIIDFLVNRRDNIEESEEGDEDADERRSSYDRWARIIAVLTAIAIILVFTLGAPYSALMKKSENPEDTTTVIEETDQEGLEEEAIAEEPVEEPWYGFYNLNLVGDEDPNNDLNFGWNPYVEGRTAEEYDADLRSRMEIDPALGAAVLAWFDANVGTSYMGVYYAEAKENWSQAINLAKEKFMADQVLYDTTLEAFFKYLGSTVREVKVEERSNINDQMYMNPFPADGSKTPQVIVLESPDHKGHFLFYEVVIKETGVYEVGFRIECGYQPCNVAEIMKITPQPQPNSVTTTPTSSSVSTVTPPPQQQSQKSGGGTPPATSQKSGGGTQTTPTVIIGGNKSGGGSSGGGYSGGSGGSGGRSTTTKKDPTKGTDVGKNDTPGPGVSTNAGKGATTSTAELPQNSNNKTSLSGGSSTPYTAGGTSYDSAIENNREANRTTRTGGSGGSSGGSSSSKSSGGAGNSNTPSSSRAGTDNVDNRASSGGNNIDTATSVKTTKVEAPASSSSSSSEATHDTSSDSRGTHWSGPAD